MGIIKGFLKGLLYIILSPLIIAGFALYVVYALILYIVEFFIATFKFFSGSKLTTETKEDKKVKQILIEKNKKIKEEATKSESAPINQNHQPTTTTINNFYITKEQLPIENAAKPQYFSSEEPKTIENKQYLNAASNEGGKEHE
jgi:hypothetical protein